MARGQRRDAGVKIPHQPRLATCILTVTFIHAHWQSEGERSTNTNRPLPVVRFVHQLVCRSTPSLFISIATLVWSSGDLRSASFCLQELDPSRSFAVLLKHCLSSCAHAHQLYLLADVSTSRTWSWLVQTSASPYSNGHIMKQLQRFDRWNHS